MCCVAVLLCLFESEAVSVPKVKQFDVVLKVKHI